MNERLKEIRKYMNMNQSEFANLLGIGQSTLAMMEVSKRDISDRHVKTICALCGVDEHWLRTGEGEMLKNHGDEFGEIAKQLNLNPFQLRLVRIVYEMPPEYQDMVLDLARKLAAEEYPSQEESDYERTGRIVTAALRKYDEEHDEPEDEPGEEEKHA